LIHLGHANIHGNETDAQFMFHGRAQEYAIDLDRPGREARSATTVGPRDTGQGRKAIDHAGLHSTKGGRILASDASIIHEQVTGQCISTSVEGG
jgi:hypothetical protein